MGVFPIRVETGRWRKLPLHQRICEQCDSGEVECELHFLLKCKKYEVLRNDFFTKLNLKYPYVQNLDELEKLCFMLNEAPFQVANFVMKIFK